MMIYSMVKVMLCSSGIWEEEIKIFSKVFQWFFLLSIFSVTAQYFKLFQKTFYTTLT